MVLKRLLRRRQRSVASGDWFTPDGQEAAASESPASPPADSPAVPVTNRAPGSFVQTLIEGDPRLEATLRGIRTLRAEGRESIRRRYMTLEDLRTASLTELETLSGIGTATAQQVLSAARDVEALIGQVKGLRTAAVASLRKRYPSVGALAGANADDLTDLPGIGPATAARIVSAARG
ncbi:MAG: helix-hairpin-helix domain-containing protein [Nitriliruptorales bacterium]|nr:helix-hairpin-helix domain-containing protein [Nitriliruptorales bacterium]